MIDLVLFWFKHLYREDISIYLDWFLSKESIVHDKDDDDDNLPITLLYIYGGGVKMYVFSAA